MAKKAKAAQEQPDQAAAAAADGGNMKQQAAPAAEGAGKRRSKKRRRSKEEEQQLPQDELARRWGCRLALEKCRCRRHGMSVLVCLQSLWAAHHSAYLSLLRHAFRIPHLLLKPQVI